MTSQFQDRSEWLAALSRKDEAAWRHFIQHHGPLILAVLDRYPSLGADRDDAFQEICLQVQRSLPSLRDPGRFSSWLYGIASHRAVDFIRRRQRTGAPVAETHGIEDRRPSPERALETVQTAALLVDLVHQLDAPCQRLLVALYLSDPPLTYQQIHDQHSMAIGSIGPTRARCLAKLRRLWVDVSSDERESTTG